MSLKSARNEDGIIEIPNLAMSGGSHSPFIARLAGMDELMNMK